MSKRSSRPPSPDPPPASAASGPSSTLQRARVTRRMIGSEPSVPGRRRQKERKSCGPSRTSDAVRIDTRSSGSLTCQATGASSGSGAGAFHTR